MLNRCEKEHGRSLALNKVHWRRGAAKPNLFFMSKRKILFIGGSYNQSTMVHAVAKNLQNDFDCFFTPFYIGGRFEFLRKWGLFDRSIAGFGNFYRDTMNYFQQENLALDPEGQANEYDLVVTCTDIILQANIKHKKFIVVQEGMTDPENLAFYLVKMLGLPYWMAVNTAATALSNKYARFCVASEGYRDLFTQKGADASRLVVTGIPNFDNVAAYLQNDFPHHGHVLAATSDTREALKYENRKKTIREALEVANGRQLIFKLHPNEEKERAIREVERWAPEALVYTTGNVHEMIANSSALITHFSTVVYTGLALGKEVYSKFDLNQLRRLTPIQNGGTSGKRISEVCREVLQ